MLKVVRQRSSRVAPSLRVRSATSRRRPVSLRAYSTAPEHTSSPPPPPPPPPPPHEHTQRTTHFGFREVPESEKEYLVGNVFSSVASKYDLMNDAMSAGIHRIWKDQFVSMLNPLPGNRIIDVAGGTGDIAFRMASHIISRRKLSNLSVGEEPGKQKQTHITILDINPNMLEEGKRNAEALQFGDNEFDAYTIAFGIRNCTHIDRVLQEAYRVLKPGGRFMCLEFSRVKNPLLSQAYDLYSFNVIPVLGKLIANDSESYQYLVESIRQFPDQDTFKSLIFEAGFRHVTYTNLTFGVAAIHSGFKPLDGSKSK